MSCYYWKRMNRALFLDGLPHGTLNISAHLKRFSHCRFCQAETEQVTLPKMSGPRPNTVTTTWGSAVTHVYGFTTFMTNKA